MSDEVSSRPVIFRLGQEVLVPHSAVIDSYGRPKISPSIHATHLVARIAGEPVYKGDTSAKILLATDYGRGDPAAWTVEVKVADLVAESPNDSRRSRASKSLPRRTATPLIK